jgi:hypothetical protein
VSTAKQDRKGLIRAAEIGIAGLIGLAIFGMAQKAHGQALPDAPQPMVKAATMPASPMHQPWATKKQYAMYAAVISTELGDAWTTEHCLAQHNGCGEAILPGAIVNHAPVMYAYSLTKAIGSIYLQRKLERMNYAQHHAWFMEALNIAQASHVALMVRQDSINIQNADKPVAQPINAPAEVINPFINSPKGWRK